MVSGGAECTWDRGTPRPTASGKVAAVRWPALARRSSAREGQHGPAPVDKADKANASAFLAVSQAALRSPPATLQSQQCTAECEFSASAQELAVPKVNLEEPSTLALYHACHRNEPAPHEGVTSVRARDIPMSEAYYEDHHPVTTPVRKCQRWTWGSRHLWQSQRPSNDGVSRGDPVSQYPVLCSVKRALRRLSSLCPGPGSARDRLAGVIASSTLPRPRPD